MQKTERNLLKTLLSSLKDHAKDIDLFLSQIRSLYGWDLFHLTSYINMHVWSTEALLRYFCGMKYLKKNAELLANYLFSMYFHVYS